MYSANTIETNAVIVDASAVSNHFPYNPEVVSKGKELDLDDLNELIAGEDNYPLIDPSLFQPEASASESSAVIADVSAATNHFPYDLEVASEGKELDLDVLNELLAGVDIYPLIEPSLFQPEASTSESSAVIADSSAATNHFPSNPEVVSKYKALDFDLLVDLSEWQDNYGLNEPFSFQVEVPTSESSAVIADTSAVSDDNELVFEYLKELIERENLSALIPSSSFQEGASTSASPGMPIVNPEDFTALSAAPPAPTAIQQQQNPQQIGKYKFLKYSIFFNVHQN